MNQFSTIDDPDELWLRALDYLKQYENNQAKNIYVIAQPNTPIGFSLVSEQLRFNLDGHAISQFFIDQSQQRKGYGRALACHVFKQHSGSWEIAVTRGNNQAYTFWENVITNYTAQNFNCLKIESYDGCGFTFHAGV